MDGSGDSLEIEENHHLNDTHQVDEKGPFDSFLKTLATEVTVQFWVLVLFGIVIFVVVLGEFDIYGIKITCKYFSSMWGLLLLQPAIEATFSSSAALQNEFQLLSQIRISEAE